jgi:hypothetical protein
LPFLFDFLPSHEATVALGVRPSQAANYREMQHYWLAGWQK